MVFQITLQKCESRRTHRSIKLNDSEAGGGDQANRSIDLMIMKRETRSCNQQADFICDEQNN